MELSSLRIAIMKTNKYQEALDVISKHLYPGFVGMLSKEKSEELLQELVNRDKDVFNHVLIVKDSRVHKRIAFHTQREALEFVQKYQIIKWSLESVRFYKESEYEKK